MNKRDSEKKTVSGFKSGFVAVVGRPNVGKSTLVNALLGTKVSIVSPKPQTTRTRIYGILNESTHQVVLVDTPGFCERDTPLRRLMLQTASNAPADADVTLIVTAVDAREPTLSKVDRDVLAAARKAGGRVVLAINKVDQIRDKQEILPWMEHYAGELEFDAIIPISARFKDGLGQLIRELVSLLPEGPLLFPADMHTDQAERWMCAELVREQLLKQTQQEVPHSVAVVIEVFQDERTDDGGLCRIEGRVYVERDSQKGIVVGKRGERIKSISQAARHQIEELLGCRVFLRMQVAVDEQWTRRESAVRSYGIGGRGGE